jgi:RND family efflux transporter MFP subunit
MTQKACIRLVIFSLGATVLGCERSKPATEATKPQEVIVALPETRQVTDYEVFTGRTEALNSITVRARVTGYLEKANFKQGADVKEGEVLFEIDPRPFRAELARTEAIVVQSEAQLARLDADFRRGSTLFSRGAIGREEYDKIEGDRKAAAGSLASAKASRDIAKLNLEWTQVKSPLTGRIGRRRIDPGNLVKADDTPLVDIVSLDPIYAYFDVDERTLLRVRRLIRDKVIKSARETEVPVWMGLADEEGATHPGTFNFGENKVDPQTGTLRAWGIFANPDNFLSPGLFVRIKVQIGAPRDAILISERALGTDQGRKFVFVVNDQNTVEYREVKIGALHDHLRVVEGISPGDRVIVSGLQRVRRGAKVQPRLESTETAATEARK